MVDLAELSPAALKAAMETGTERWGQWGSAAHHALYVEKIEPGGKHWRMCRCGCRKRSTHRVAANGVTLGTGCELRAHRLARELGTWRGVR